MNRMQMAKTAYSATSQTPIRTTRGTEYEIIATITHKMRQAIASEQQNFAQLVQALHDNRKLWTLLASDVAENDNALPASLRAQVFYLAEFTIQHSRKVLLRTGDPEILVEINTAMMRGLRQLTESA